MRLRIYAWGNGRDKPDQLLRAEQWNFALQRNSRFFFLILCMFVLVRVRLRVYWRDKPNHLLREEQWNKSHPYSATVGFFSNYLYLYAGVSAFSYVLVGQRP